MRESFYRLIKEKYLTKGDDYTELFKTICLVAGKIGLDKALECLEGCVIQKKILWLKRNLDKIKKGEKPMDDVIKIFYEIYLGISFGRDGEIIKKTDKKLIIRCWNKCPVLEACKRFNLDTKKVCRGAYHRWVQIFLSRIHPKLKFHRNYNSIRPYTPYCEEVITLDG